MRRRPCTAADPGNRLPSPAVAAPWSHSLSLSWPPQVAFFDLRTRILESLQAAGLLSAFRWTEAGSISGRLGPAEVIEVSSGGGRLGLVGPGARLSEAKKALSVVLGVLAPPHLTFNGLLLQYLEPIAMTYDDARMRSGVTMVGPALPSLETTDWAYWVDGRSPQDGLPFWLECGIINAAEAPARVGRRTGRFRGDWGSIPAELIDRPDYPPCAFFADWRWIVNRRIGEEDLPALLFDMWDGLVSRSDQAVAEAIATALPVNDDIQLRGGVR